MYVGGPEEACVVCGEHYGNHGLEGSRGYRFFKDRQESEIITCIAKKLKKKHKAAAAREKSEPVNSRRGSEIMTLKRHFEIWRSRGKKYSKTLFLSRTWRSQGGKQCFAALIIRKH